MEDSKPPRSRNVRKRTLRKPRNRRCMPQAPQVKVTVRKIQDMERFGSVSQILKMFQTIVEKTNEENKHKQIFLPIQLEESSMQRLIEDETLVKSAKAIEESQAEETVVQKEPVEEVKNEEGDVVMEEMKEVLEESKQPKSDAAGTGVGPRFSTVVKGNHHQQQTETINGPVISARALYAVPPKKSHRRGIKSGCAYFVLHGPSVAQSEDEYTNMTQVERSRVTAKARLQLSTAVEALSKHGEEDAKTSQQYGGCVIQQSISGKTWKANYYDNREGTMETTADYQRFMAKTEKEQEERMSRPRPTPGGAMGDPASAENGEQVSAIVLHLLAKRKQEARRRKAAAKKTSTGKDPKDKKGGSKDDSRKSSNRSGGRSKQDRQKSKGGGKKKSDAPSKPAPMPAPVLSAAEFPTL